MQSSYWQEQWATSSFDIIILLLTLGLGWLVGHRLTAYWAVRQKRRELELSALNEFYRLYGEFFATWKSWSYCRRARSLELVCPDEARWDLLKRASVAEGALEAVFVKLSSERVLSDLETEVLGRFRQAYQSLRESIRDDKGIGWPYQNCPEYLTFKRLAYLTALILSGDHPTPGFRRRTKDTLREITSGTWEQKRWVIKDEDDWKHLSGGSGNAASGEAEDSDSARTSSANQ